MDNVAYRHSIAWIAHQVHPTNKIHVHIIVVRRCLEPEHTTHGGPKAFVQPILNFWNVVENACRACGGVAPKAPHKLHFVDFGTPTTLDDLTAMKHIQNGTAEVNWIHNINFLHQLDYITKAYDLWL